MHMVHHFSMQPSAALKMLSPSPPPSSSTCPSRPNPNKSSLAPSMTKPTLAVASLPSKILPFTESAQTLSNSQTHSVTKCFSSTTNPVPVCGSLEECPLVVVSFYKFADFPDHADLRKPLKELCERLCVSGGIILAPEGINGSICGTRDSVEEVLSFIQNDERLKGLRRIESPVSPEEEAIHHGHSSSSPLAAAEDAPFRWDHVRVKLKKEIVTLGMPSVSPMEKVGTYVSPKEWNKLISDPDTVVVDVRNGYEIRIGKFKQAVDPCTRAFREFPFWVDERFGLSEVEKSVEPASPETTAEQYAEMDNKMPRVAMYCTGGIRCEKASSFLLNKGFKEALYT